jgi:hypothetical protein
MTSIYQSWLNGELNKAIELGVIKHSIILYCAIYQDFKSERDKGKTYLQAVEITSERLCVSRATVKRAVAVVL